MSQLPSRRLRCAVYTRKSTEEGLDMEYTSIDAQRDAGHAYIASRRSEGWVPAVEDYDDGGFSGGSLDRPALRRLIADIQAGQVDIVVAYKLDRLSRSLFDFAELVKLFDQHGVTFVSVTQQFNTTDAMGRMLLNILLTFAQFERELTAERIRDKFLASKKKGLWMSGIPPLGYTIKDRRLAVELEEAELIRHIFERFAAVGSLLEVVNELRAQNARTKTWQTRAGHIREGKPHDKSSVRTILLNRVYLGELKHKDTFIVQCHEPIIEPSLWEAVQSILRKPGRVRANANRGKVDFLLKGLVYGSDGRALTPWHTTRKGRRYRYYISTRELHGHGKHPAIPRLPAAELEEAVVEQLRGVFQSSEMLQAVIVQAVAQDATLDEAQVTVAMRQVDQIWAVLHPPERRRLLQLIVERVEVDPAALKIQLRPLGLKELARELRGAA